MRGCGGWRASGRRGWNKGPRRSMKSPGVPGMGGLELSGCSERSASDLAGRRDANRWAAQWAATGIDEEGKRAYKLGSGRRSTVRIGGSREAGPSGSAHAFNSGRVACCRGAVRAEGWADALGGAWGEQKRWSRSLSLIGLGWQIGDGSVEDVGGFTNGQKPIAGTKDDALRS